MWSRILGVAGCIVAVEASASSRTSKWQRGRGHLAMPAEHFLQQGCRRGDASCCEQVHIQLGGPEEMVVVYLADSLDTPSQVLYHTVVDKTPQVAYGYSSAYSQMNTYAHLIAGHGAMGKPTTTDQHIMEMQDTTSWAKNSSYSAAYYKPDYDSNPFLDKDGNLLWEVQGNYMNPQEYYDSALIHTVKLENLDAGATYFYTVGDDKTSFNFTMPDTSITRDSFVVGLTSDLGQTAVSERNVETLSSWKPDVVLLAGDLSYADGYDYRWDSYALMMQQLNAFVPVMATPGNHEVSAGKESGKSYNFRYPMPHRESGSPSDYYWSRDVGPMHVISLSSYSGTGSNSLQYQWLVRDLAKVNRALTPWLVVMMHAPWYNSNSGHRNEALLMLHDMEELFYENGVDLVVSGHTHAYERTHPMYKNVIDACGPVYLNLGDGGNHEGALVPWIEPQPEWSAFRESSFGVGRLEFVNSTHANYQWHRNACNDKENVEDYGISFAKDCVSTGDNSGNHAQTESVWLIRSTGEEEGIESEKTNPGRKGDGRKLSHVEEALRSFKSKSKSGIKGGAQGKSTDGKQQKTKTSGVCRNRALGATQVLVSDRDVSVGEPETEVEEKLQFDFRGKVVEVPRRERGRGKADQDQNSQ